MFEIWEGDLYLYTVDTHDEADEQAAAGFTVKSLAYYGAQSIPRSVRKGNVNKTLPIRN